MIEFFAKPAGRWVGGIVILFLVALAIHHSGAVSQLNKDKSAGADQSARTVVTDKSTNKISKKAEVNHEASDRSISAVYSGLRQLSGSGAVSKVPDPAREPDAATRYYVSVAPDLAESCAKATQQLIDLQSWVKDEQEAVASVSTGDRQ